MAIRLVVLTILIIIINIIFLINEKNNFNYPQDTWIEVSDQFISGNKICQNYYLVRGTNNKYWVNRRVIVSKSLKCYK